MRVIFALLALALGLILISSSAKAAPEVNWNGPACQDGTEKYAMCSTEPTGDNTPPQCYQSHSIDTGPDQVQMALIALCQAAKAALIATGDNRDDALNRVIGFGAELNATAANDPAAAQNSANAINTVGHDLQALGASMIVFSSSESDDDWQDVSDNLESLALDAQISM